MIIRHLSIDCAYINKVLEPITQREHGVTEFEIEAKNHGADIDLSECTLATYYGLKPDEHKVGVECRVDKDKGLIYLPLYLQMTTAEGVLKGIVELQFPEGNVRFSGVSFKVSFAPDDTKIESTDDFNVLENFVSKPTTDGVVGQVLSIDNDGNTIWRTLKEFDGDYAHLSNRPSINGVELNGDKSLEDLNIKQTYTAEDKSELTTEVTENLISDLDNRKDVDLFISDSYGNVLATFKDGEFITKEFSTVKSIGNNICDTLEECDLAISDVQGNVIFCIVNGNIITPKYNAKNHYKTFSILGDSYSTFKDYTDPLNNTQWYPPSDSATQGSENDVEDVENTWWHLFANDYKSLLIQNNSYSGSCISYDSYGTGTVDGKNFSFVKRCENLKKAELIIIEGGTNDAWSNVSLGEYKYSNWVESDFETFRPACSYVLDYIKRNNIGAKIIFVLNDGLKSSITESIKNICNYYNVDVLELSNIKKSNNHPNIEGMKQIKEQLINFLLRGDFNG